MNFRKTILWCDRVMVFSFCALIFFLPIAIALTESFAGLALFFFILKRVFVFRGQIQDGSLNWPAKSFGKRILELSKVFKPVENCLNWPLGIFLFVVLLSVLFSQFPHLSWRGFIGKTLEYALLFVMFLECMNSRKRIKIFLVVYCISFTLICINGIFQYWTGAGFIHGHLVEAGRVSSSLRQANDFGAYLLFLIPALFFLSVLYHKKRKKAVSEEFLIFAFLKSFWIRTVIFLVFMSAISCLGLTLSRGAWLAFILSLFLAGCARLRISLPCLLLIFAFLFIVVPILKERSDGGLGYISGMMRTENQADRELIMTRLLQHTNNRMVYWRGTGEMIKDYPILGSGLNTYTQIVGRYKEQWGGYPHNCYLQMTVETGLLGVTAFLWMIFVLFWNSLRSLRHIQDQTHQLLVLGFLTGLLAFLLHSFVDTNLYSVQLSSLMWIIMGLIVALQKVNEQPAV